MLWTSCDTLPISHVRRGVSYGRIRMMKAIQLDRLGGAEVMELREIPIPGAASRYGAGEESRHRHQLRRYLLPSRHLPGQTRFPETPSMEASGIIAAAAPDVTGLQPGMRVA